jgi:hypothetical protein
MEDVANLNDSGFDILKPDLLVTAVGSDCYSVNSNNGNYERLEDYHEIFDDTHWES